MINSKVNCAFFQKLSFTLFLCLGGGWLMGLFTQTHLKEWYPSLIKPSTTPPSLVFPIVWTILYILMSISLALLWTTETFNKGKAFLFFFIQLFLNFIWSFLFFYLREPGYALIDNSLLAFFLLLTIMAFWRHTQIGSLLLIPYLLWVGYAFYLNAFIWFYN